MENELLIEEGNFSELSRASHTSVNSNFGRPRRRTSDPTGSFSHTIEANETIIRNVAGNQSAKMSFNTKVKEQVYSSNKSGVGRRSGMGINNTSMTSPQSETPPVALVDIPKLGTLRVENDGKIFLHRQRGNNNNELQSLPDMNRGKNENYSDIKTAPEATSSEIDSEGLQIDYEFVKSEEDEAFGRWDSG